MSGKPQGEQHRCGRRDDMLVCTAEQRGVEIDTDLLPKLDTWRPAEKRELGRTCSHCGSMHPDDLFKAIDAGIAELGPTDKNYKMYVEGTLLDHPERPEQFHHKFYFQHFDDEQQKRFIDYLNAGKLKLGYPGRFYSLPYFIRRG